jgi:hypothetical protein
MKSRNVKAVTRHTKPLTHSVCANLKSDRRRGMLVNQRVRGTQRNLELPFMPPEDWHEPKQASDGYKIVQRQPGDGYRHILTADDIRRRLAEVPQQFVQSLEVVQLSRMTRKKLGFPCYGIQWGVSIYLYPIELDLIERHAAPPTPRQRTEARMYGGVWEQEPSGVWRLTWTEETIRDFYLNNILIHELGHLVDTRNTRYMERERYAEWFAVEYGYRRSRRPDGTRIEPSRRHAGRVRRLTA